MKKKKKCNHSEKTSCYLCNAGPKTFEEKIKECFKKINIKRQKIDLHDLLQLQELPREKDLQAN